MMKTGMKKTAGLLLSFLFAVSAWGTMPGSTGFAAVDPSTLTALDRYPGIRTFDFSVPPDRDSISEEQMVNADYCIKFSKLVPDEYFGANVSSMADPVSGSSIDGIMLGTDGVKGSCGCIYRQMFQYRDNWIDVRTTYMDWSLYVPKSAFMAGGFAHHRWKNTWWVEMKHEFFISGTNTPVNVKGFLEYDDVDNSQGIYLDMNEIDDLWVNSGGTTLGYKNIPGGVQYVQNAKAKYVVDRNMLCIQSMTNDDIPISSEAGYSATTAAKTCFALTFSASTLHTCMVDDDIMGFNILDSSDSKYIPSALPENDPLLVGKNVSDDDESDVTSNSVRSWEDWTYRINVRVPPETEPGNFYEAFAISDRIDSDLVIGDVRITRGAGEDVTDLFAVTTADNLVKAEALDTEDEDFYGYDYFMYIDVTVGKTRDEMIREEKLDDEFRHVFLNSAEVSYREDDAQEGISTNETDTTVRYEVEADIVITKEIRAADNYAPHGKPVFIFSIRGRSVSGKDIVRNGCIEISSDGTAGTFTFRDVPEGEYTCSEYETLRFEPEAIRNVSGGRVSGDGVIFTIDSTEERRASFLNRKKNWDDYSDSNVVINRIGIN